MESTTFRKWLIGQGCHIDGYEHLKKREGHQVLTVRRDGRKAHIPLPGTHQALDPRLVQQVCMELGLDPSQLPGPQSRV